jgi:hypothetical protein
MNDYTDFEADELADLKREFNPRKRHAISCCDRMCGADDCETCHPGCSEPNEQETENENE